MFAGVAAKQILSIVKQEVPLSLTGKPGLQTLVDEFDEIRILWRLTRIYQRDWKEKEREQQSKDVQATGQEDTGPRVQPRSPVLVVSETKPWQGLDAWLWRR